MIYSIELKFSGVVVLSAFCGISLDFFRAVYSVEVIRIETYGKFSGTDLTGYLFMCFQLFKNLYAYHSKLFVFY